MAAKARSAEAESIRVKSNISSNDEDGVDVDSWVYQPSDVPPLGLAGTLYEAILALFTSITQQLAEAKSDLSSHSHQLHTELERLFLWGDGVSASDYQLDEVLSRTTELRYAVFSSLYELGKAIKDELLPVVNGSIKTFPFVDASKELQMLLEKTAIFLNGSEDDAVDHENLSDNEPTRYDMEDILDDISTYINCLMDLSLAIENPVIDIEPGDPTSQCLSSDQSLAFRRRIQDRFPRLEKFPVERLDEANSTGTVQAMELQGNRFSDVETKSETNELCASELIFSESQPQVTSGMYSMFQSDSLFDNPLQHDDGWSDVTFVSTSEGQPHVPHLPDGADKGAPFIKDIHTMVEGHISDTWFKEIEDWLSPLEPSKRHHSIRDLHLPNTGIWILEQDEFLKWLSDSPTSPYLCCYGDPGAGKTFITSVVIDHLERRKAATPNMGLAYIYCDYRDKTLQATGGVVGAIAKQLFRQLPNLPEEIAAILTKSCQPELARKTEALSIICNLFHPVFICLDALDECQDLPELLICLRNASSSVRVFSTGRKHVQPIIKTYFGPTETINIEAKESDIKVLVKERIHQDRKKDPSLMNVWLEGYITEKVSVSSKGTFLLPELQMRTILEGRTRRERREATDTLPLNLMEAFGSTIDRIRKQPDAWVGRATTILSWTCLATSPLSIDQLLEACAIREGDHDLDIEDFPSRETFLQSCLGLVKFDAETSTVRLVHFSLDKYLKNTGKIINRTIADGNEIIGRACLTYLLFRSVTGGSLQQALIGSKEEAAEISTPQHALLNYAACQWGHHIRKSGCQRRSTIDLALEYLKLSWQRRVKSQMHLYNHLRIRNHDPASFSIVHIVAYFGIHQVLSELLKAGDIKVDSRDGTHGRTPLSWAAGSGHEAVVKLLLETGRVDPNLKDGYGRTPLWWAVGKGHEAVVKLLLATGRVDPNLKDRHGRLPLSVAAGGGHKAVVKLLLATGRVDPDSKDSSGQTLLSQAARSGHEAVVRLLLATGRVDPDARDRYTDRTPLSLVAGSGHESVAKLLLETGKVDPDSKDRYGRTPLSWAAWGGHEAVAKLLLKTGRVEPDSKDRYGRTPLLWAACSGREAVVKLLLETGRANPDSKDSDHQTPLSWAAENGYNAVVNLLLATGRLDPDSKDSSRKTPLLRAAQRGHEAVVKLLLTPGRVDRGSDGGPGSRTPLLWAAGSGHEAVAERLLAKGRVDPDSKDSNYQTPLYRAAWKGHKTVVKLLLDTGRVDPGSEDRFGQTPLSRAVEKGYEDVAMLLRSTDRVKPVWADATVVRMPLW